MPVFVGQNHVPEYDPPPPPLTKEEQEKVDYEAYNERQRLKFEIPPPQWKGKYRPKTTPKYEYVSVVPHYPTEPRIWEDTVVREFTEDEVSLRTDVDNFNKEEKDKQLNPVWRRQKLQKCSSSFVPRESVKDFRVEIQKMLAPGEFLHEPWKLEGPRVARKITKYSYPETDFQLPPLGKKPASLDICYHYNEDENRVLQGFAEQGWELVSCCVNVTYGKTFYFKRELELIPDTTNAD
jgi:hypothetical protein